MDIQELKKNKNINAGKVANGLSYCIINGQEHETFPLVMQGNFFFGFVIHGTASISCNGCRHLLEKAALFFLTPSMSASLDGTDKNCKMCCIRISPDFFDTLHEGQPTYNQLANFFTESNLPNIYLDTRQFDYLKNTVSLFNEMLESFVLNQEGILRHLCSFFLLQIANAFYRKSDKKTICVLRSHEIYRQFKKLAVENYRTSHQIAFYADKMHITTTYLSRTVKTVTGRTVHSIISELIYADAIKLLDCTDLDIKEIAETLGFPDQSTFGKFFAKKAGTSPLRFRLRKQQACSAHGEKQP